MLNGYNPKRNTLRQKLILAKYLIVVLAVSIIATAGCSTNPHNKKSAMTWSDSSSLEVIILDDSLPMSSRENAIDILKQRKDWKSLVNVLPPRGHYGHVSLVAIDAIVKIRCLDAVPYLEELNNTRKYVPGQFWLKLDNAIDTLKKEKGE